MGIQGLLPVFKSITKPVHIESYKGQKVAVDGYSWLHKGAYACSQELCEGRWTDKFVTYCLSRVEMLRKHGVEPIVVFDGGRLPSKSSEEESRHRSRREQRERAEAHMQAGNTAAAVECYQRSVDVTPQMARQVIESLKQRGIEYLVAPYEADAQLTYLALHGHVHAVITEDSDMLAYGCPRVLFKLDKFGNGEEICLADIKANRGLSFVGFNHDMFLAMCIMAGCDFLPSLPGIGVKTAHGHMRKFKSFVKMCKSLRFSGTAIPRDYEQHFQRAIWVFRHQRVYCPSTRALVHLRPLPAGGLGGADVEVPDALPTGDELQDLTFLGPCLPSDAIAQGIASGDLDPFTYQPFDLDAIFRNRPGGPPGRHHSGGGSQRHPGHGSGGSQQQQQHVRRYSGGGGDHEAPQPHGTPLCELRPGTSRPGLSRPPAARGGAGSGSQAAGKGRLFEGQSSLKGLWGRNAGSGGASGGAEGTSQPLPNSQRASGLLPPRATAAARKPPRPASQPAATAQRVAASGSGAPAQLRRVACANVATRNERQSGDDVRAGDGCGEADEAQMKPAMSPRCARHTGSSSSDGAQSAGSWSQSLGSRRPGSSRRDSGSERGVEAGSDGDAEDDELRALAGGVEDLEVGGTDDLACPSDTGELAEASGSEPPPSPPPRLRFGQGANRVHGLQDGARFAQHEQLLQQQQQQQRRQCQQPPHLVSLSQFLLGVDSSQADRLQSSQGSDGLSGYSVALSDQGADASGGGFGGRRSGGLDSGAVAASWRSTHHGLNGLHGDIAGGSSKDLGEDFGGDGLQGLSMSRPGGSGVDLDGGGVEAAAGLARYMCATSGRPLSALAALHDSRPLQLVPLQCTASLGDASVSFGDGFDDALDDAVVMPLSPRSVSQPALDAAADLTNSMGRWGPESELEGGEHVLRPLSCSQPPPRRSATIRTPLSPRFSPQLANLGHGAARWPAVHCGVSGTDVLLDESRGASGLLDLRQRRQQGFDSRRNAFGDAEEVLEAELLPGTASELLAASIRGYRQPGLKAPSGRNGSWRFQHVKKPPVLPLQHTTAPCATLAADCKENLGAGQGSGAPHHHNVPYASHAAERDRQLRTYDGALASEGQRGGLGDDVTTLDSTAHLQYQRKRGPSAQSIQDLDAEMDLNATGCGVQEPAGHVHVPLQGEQDGRDSVRPDSGDGGGNSEGGGDGEATGGPGFHSVRHVHKFARYARAAMDRVENGVLQESATAAAAAVPPAFMAAPLTGLRGIAGRVSRNQSRLKQQFKPPRLAQGTAVVGDTQRPITAFGRFMCKD